MASKPETVFINSVNRYVGPEVYYMKNHNEYVGGVADSWYSGHINDLWVEYKFIILPKRDSTMIIPALSSLQKEWCRDRWEEGRRVEVIVGCKKGGVVFNHPDAWEKGLTTKDFVSEIQTRSQLAIHIESRTI